MAGTIRPSRLSGVTLASDDVRYYTTNEAGEIDRLILDNVTGDLWTYGVLDDVRNLTSAAADVIVMDYKPFTPFSDANIDGHMLFGMTGRQCQTTMINGRILMRDRVLTEIDEEAVNAHILESSKRLWGRLNHREY